MDLYSFFLYIQNVNWILSEKQRKALKKDL